MAWKTKKSDTTPHTCGGPKFGHLAPKGTCPRCDELHNGAKPVAGWNDAKNKMDAQRRAYMAAYYAPGGEGYRLRQAGLGHLDTAFEW